MVPAQMGMLGRTSLLKRGRISATLLVGFFILLAAVAYYFGYQNPIFDHITKGLDLAGGVRVVLEAEDTVEAPVTPEAMSTAVEVIRQRVDSLGVVEPSIRQMGVDRIEVELPGADPDRALEVIGRTAKLEFIDPDGEVVLTGANLVRAQAAFGPLGEPIVTLQFDAEGTRRFREATERLVGQTIAIAVDDEIITNPVVREPIPTGEAQISGGFDSLEEAQNLAVALSSGALPVKLNVVENRSVSASLGEASIAQSSRAAIYGILAVVLFLLVVYRLPGFMANAALLVFTLLLLGALYLLNATLTLPGIAGIILSIGMAVDANVIIYERIREELRLGKTARSAVIAGFRNAFSAILDANVTTLIATAALFYWGTGPVQGFAVTLSVGIVCSMFSAIVVTRFLLLQLVDAGIVRDPRRLFGVKEAV